MMKANITTPVADVRTIEALRVGDEVYITGVVRTARDMAHAKLKDLDAKGKQFPYVFDGSVIYHAGPVATKQNGKWVIRSLGPTTSSRMEPYSEFIGGLGAKILIGKGGMGADTQAVLKKYKMLYLSALPGCGALGAQAVQQVLGVNWLDLGMPEAMWELKVKDWGPLIVTMDCQGGDLHTALREAAHRHIETMYPTA